MTKTVFKQPDDPFGKLQKAGEVCQSCRVFWKAQRLPPRRMVSLGIRTEEKGGDIVVCPHCDGSRIIELGRHPSP